MAATEVATAEPALLQSDDCGRVIGQVPLGDGPRLVRDGLQQANNRAVEARKNGRAQAGGARAD